MMTAHIAEGRRLGHLHGRAGPSQPTGNGVERLAHCRADRQPVDRRHDRHPQARELVRAGRGQLQPPGNVFARVGPGRDIKPELEILGRARQWTLDAHHRRGIGSHRLRKLSGAWQRCLAGFVSKHATEGGRDANGAADIAAELERTESSRDSRGTATGAAAGGARGIPRVYSPAVDRVGALPVGQHGRNVGLAQQHGAGPEDALGDRAVFGRPVISEVGHSSGGGQPAYVH